MDKPNILFIFSDQQHWQAVGRYDHFFETPNMDRLINEGIAFDNAFCSCPQSSPSRASLLTGLYPHKTGVLGNVRATGGNELKRKTIGRLLQNCGYYTGYFGKWHLGKNSIGTSGWDEDFGVTGEETTNDDLVSQKAIEFIDKQATSEKPFALFLSYNNPHDIYQFSEGKVPELSDEIHVPLSESWEKQDFSKVPSVQKQFMEEDQGNVIHDKDQSEWKKYRLLYKEKVRLFDEHLGKVLNRLNEQFLTNKTIIVVTSDHGDMDTNHKLIYKGPFMYEHMLRVPLIFKLPKHLSKVKPATSFSFDTINTDLVPTLMDFATGIVPDSDGFSLKPLLIGESTLNRDFIISQYYSKQKWVNPIRTIRTHDFKYSKYITHGEELYHLKRDLNELENLADNPAYAEQKKILSEKLDSWIDENIDSFYSFKPTDRSGNELT